jgi:uncharacterized protein YuzE
VLLVSDNAIFAYDANVGALYYRLTREPVARTMDIDGRVMVDVDGDGKAVGIEVLDAPGFSVSVSIPAPLTMPGSGALPSGGFITEPWRAVGTTCARCGRMDCAPNHERHREGVRD